MRGDEAGGTMNPFAAIRRNVPFFVATTVLVVCATAILVVTKPSHYRSEAELLVATGYLSGAYGAQILDVPASTKSQVLVTQTALASLPAVAAQTSRDLGGRFSPAEVDERVSVTGSQDIDIITIVATASGPADAALLATTYAQAVVARAAALAGHEIDTALADVRRRLAAYDGETSRRQRQSVEALREREAQLEMLAAGADGGLQIVQPGTRPERLDNFVLPQLFLGLLAGLVLGAGAALAADRWHRRIRASDVTERLDAPILGRLYRQREPARGAVDLSDAPAREAASLIAFGIDEAASRAGDKAIVVSSPARREGRTTLAASLALALAESGKNVALVEGDLRNPRLEDLLGVEPRDGGLGSVLEDGESALAAVRPVPLNHGVEGSLQVLAAGAQRPEQPSILLARPRLARAVEALKDGNDYVIIDSPPALDFPDTQFLARSADSLVAVIDEKRTDLEALDRLREIAELASCRIAGAVLVSAERDEAGEPPAAAEEPSEKRAPAAPDLEADLSEAVQGAGSERSQSVDEDWLGDETTEVADEARREEREVPAEEVAVVETQAWHEVRPEDPGVPEEQASLDTSLWEPEDLWMPNRDPDVELPTERVRVENPDSADLWRDGSAAPPEPARDEAAPAEPAPVSAEEDGPPASETVTDAVPADAPPTTAKPRKAKGTPKEPEATAAEAGPAETMEADAAADPPARAAANEEMKPKRSARPKRAAKARKSKGKEDNEDTST